MNWDKTTTAPCIVPEAPVADPRCLNSDFALANPDICTSQAALIIKPSTALLCVLDSVQFKVYAYQNGVETELTEGVTFGSSDLDTFVVGVNGGAGTALAAGSANITATYGELTVDAELTVLPGDNCCDDISVRTAIVVDNSRSMSLNFGGGYSTRLVFAKEVASAYGGLLASNDDGVKDAVKVWSLNTVVTPLLADFSQDTAAILAAIAGITQTQAKTNLLEVFSLAASNLLDTEADMRVLLLISDGEQTLDGVTRQAILDLATAFKAAGGKVIVIGARASATLSGYDLLERIATGGFFFNAVASTAQDALASLNFIKNLLCAGDCLPAGDTYANVPSLNYSSFLNWEIFSGQVNLLGPGLLDLLPGNGLYLELAYPGTSARSTIRSIDSFALVTGNVYTISFKIAGNQVHSVSGAPPKVYLREVGAADTDANVFESNTGAAWNSPFTPFSFSFTATSDQTVKLYFSHQPVGEHSGALIDDIVFANSSTLVTLLADNFDSENLQYVPPRCGASAAVEGIDDSAVPEVSQVLYGGSDIELSEDYVYSISWVTNDGETAEAVAAVFAATADTESAIRLDLPTPPAEVTAVRIWRSVSDASPDRFLLATVTPENTTYFDLESHAEFAARYDVGLTPPTSNTTGMTAGELGFGYADCCDYYSAYADECPDCATEAPGAQSPDPAMLADIEGGVVPPQPPTPPTPPPVGCPTGFINLNATGSPASLISNVVVGDTIVTTWHLTGAAIVPGYYRIGGIAGFFPIAWRFEGSNNGSTWTVLDTKLGQSSSNSAIRTALVESNTTAYSYFRLVITDWAGPIPSLAQPPLTSDGFVYAAVAATAASADLLNCQPYFTVTKIYTAACSPTTFGNPVTVSKTRTSLVSASEAEADALAAATLEADAALDCTLSNNTQLITILDSTGGLRKAAPYPSVLFVEDVVGTITKVVINILGFSHGFPPDVRMLLVSPAGTAVEILRHSDGVPPSANAAVNLNLTFDDAAAGFMSFTVIVAGTFKPTQVGAALSNFPSPAPQTSPYDTTLAAFIGEDPNGAWCLYICDDTALDSGSIAGGFTLTITAA